MDFVHDQLFDGCKIGVLTIVDTLSPAIDVRQSYRGSDVVATLERAATDVGLPKTIRVDNGLEFVGKKFDLWAFPRGARLLTPTQADRQPLHRIVQRQVPR
jgi:putative transposase